MASKVISSSRKRVSPRPDEPTPLRGQSDKGDRSDSFLLLLWHELPSWQQDNEFILSGYRPASGSFRQSLRSLRHVHNETGTYLTLNMSARLTERFVVNIYSHLFGAVLFVALPFYTYSRVYPRYSSAQLGDIIVFSTFFFGVAICFFLSAWYALYSSDIRIFWLIDVAAQLPYGSKP
ncbi:MAG: hypothetical protein M1829_005080 [Trizodia sp. TS-e1964]|nr:MAG: hypothetical protein M1829_005080 [Trizodia sp. TS-e1964]